MKLQQVDLRRLQPPQGFVDLLGCGVLGPTVDLGHEEDSSPVAVTQSIPHADFTDAIVIVPTVVHERDSPVDGAPDDPDALVFVRLFPDVIPAQTDGRDLLSSPP